ncbi:MAG: Pr6Pr family membrane protein [Chloroflexi bacterium]|nr:Pr6Pr family membrane protein [Chloroflexota bacterium]
MMERGRPLQVMRVAAVLVVLAAIVVQAITLANAGAFNATRFFAFFTIQSNLVGVAAFVLLIAGRGREPSRGLDLLRGGAVIYLTVTFFVVIFLLSGIDVQLQLVWVDVVLHKLFPIVVVIDWILDPPRTRLTLRDVMLWIVYPLIWTALTLVRGAVDSWYPYPFLDPANGGYAAVAATAVAITVAFVVIGVAALAIGTARARSVRPV